MEIYKITKGYFAPNKNGDVKPHKNKLRFHISINGKFYEYAIHAINKTTINIICVVSKTKDHDKCLARVTLIPGNQLKTTKKECNSKKTKFEWDDTNNEADYFDIKSYTIKDHSCTEICLKGCVRKHSCPGSRDMPCDKGENSTLASKDFVKAGESIAKKGLFFLRYMSTL